MTANRGSIMWQRDREEDARFARVDDEKVSCYWDIFKKPLLMVAIKKSKLSADLKDYQTAIMVGTTNTYKVVTDLTRHHKSNIHIRFCFLGENKQCTSLQAARSWKPWWRIAKIRMAPVQD